MVKFKKNRSREANLIGTFRRVLSFQPRLIFLFALLSVSVLFALPARPQESGRSDSYTGEPGCAPFNRPSQSRGQLQIDLSGLVSTWGGFSRASGQSLGQLGARFLPEFNLTFVPPSRKVSASNFTVEGSLNFQGSLTVQPGAENQFSSRLKPYRLSLRYTAPRFEARLGLQKISFGSASLLRPLMWFDRIDPRDPLQLTDGVYALLLRAYLSSRTNLWAWALYGNDEPKGWEILPTRRHRPEAGFRAQVPLGPGELGFTAHRRRVEFNLSTAASNPAVHLIPLKPSSPLTFTFPETRLAADGKWDIGPGIWFEAALTDQRSPYLAFPWQRALTIGFDYTFTLGNGLHLLGEYYQSDLSTGAFSAITYAPFRTRFLATSISYPLSFIDQLAAIFFYDTRSRDFYSFVRWQRQYDRWSIHLMAFWNPAEFRLFAATDQPNLFAGKGLQLLIVYTF
ncbi:MAG: hypothetical protein QME28_07705 [Candidatus Saccharicenans sp.]|nr:hypothetical protein [Candidatus Saccharicenans sp.]